MLGYIIPVSIYLKTHEEKVRVKFAEWGVMASSPADCFGYETDCKDQREFNKKIFFFMILGVFGVCSLLIGLTIELMSIFGMAQQVKPTDNY